MTSLALNFLGGAPFQLLYDGVKIAIRTTKKFRTHLENLEFTLECLQPRIIQQISANNVQLNIPNDLIRDLETKMEEGKELVYKLSRLGIWNIRIWGNCCNCIMPNYADQLAGLDRSLRRLLEILKLEQIRNVQENLLLARNHNDKQDELDQKMSELLKVHKELLKEQKEMCDMMRVQHDSVHHAMQRILVDGVQNVQEEAAPAPSPAYALGIVFRMLFDVAIQVKVKNTMCKRLIQEFKSTLDFSKPLIEEMAECNKVLHLPDQEQEDIIMQMTKGVELIHKCSKVRKGASYKKYECTNKLVKLDESLQVLFHKLSLQIEKHVKEALVSITSTEAVIKKIEGSGLEQNQIQIVVAKPEPPLHVLNTHGRKDVERTRDDMNEKEVGVKQIEGKGMRQSVKEIKGLSEVPETSSPITGLDVQRTNDINEPLDSERRNIEAQTKQSEGIVPPQVPHTDFGNRRIPKGPVNLNSYHHVNPITYSPHNYKTRTGSPMLHTGWRSHIDSDNDGYGERHLGRMIKRKGQVSHPVAGGAPFITCFHCFELLKLPRKFKKISKNQSQLRCGSCLTVITLEIKNKRLITFAPKESKQSSSEVDQNSNEVFNGIVLSSPDRLNAEDTKSCHYDLDNLGYNFQLIDAKDNSLAEDEKLSLDESEKREGLSSSSSISSKEEEDIPDSMIELLKKYAYSPLAPGSPLWEQPDSPSKHEVRRDEKENNTCMDQDNVLFSRSTSTQNSVKDMPVETEVDDSFNDYLNTGISQDPTEASKEDRPKIRKGADNFLVGLIKKSSKDSSKSYQIVERTKVLINGQPIPDHLVRKAEKLAGPIQPGDYWYDFRAGFWGVMGQSCLGVIPPFIEEFNYPMPTNCGAGNTGVYVNGRELHQRDLDLLACRGLPTTRERFYILEISGRVVDEDSGEELNTLGKLAPTIEKTKHGFGMKVPRMAV